LEEVEARRETTTAMANSRMRLRVARMWRVRQEMRSVQRATRRMMLMMKVRAAAMMMKAAKLLKFLLG
jgi:hypothetical protein